MSNFVSIGEASALSGVKVETIRYYERVGLMPRPVRSESRQRRYGNAMVARLRFIKRCRELGFSLDDVRTLLELGNGQRVDQAAVRAVTMRQLLEVRARIDSLRALERILDGLAVSCCPGRQSRCPILDALMAGNDVFPTS